MTIKLDIMLCFECGWETTGRKNALNMHFERKHKELSLNCTKCAKICTSVTTLRDHMRMVHGNKKGCEFCEKQFATQGNLNKHVKIAHEETNYICKKCEKSSLVQQA